MPPTIIIVGNVCLHGLEEAFMHYYTTRPIPGPVSRALLSINEVDEASYIQKAKKTIQQVMSNPNVDWNEPSPWEEYDERIWSLITQVIGNN